MEAEEEQAGQTPGPSCLEMSGDYQNAMSIVAKGKLEPACLAAPRQLLPCRVAVLAAADHNVLGRQSASWLLYITGHTSRLHAPAQLPLESTTTC